MDGCDNVVDVESDPGVGENDDVAVEKKSVDELVSVTEGGVEGATEAIVVVSREDAASKPSRPVKVPAGRTRRF
mgnify:CR=1 FL=1